MIKKIAKKSLLILLLFIITIYGVLTPFKNVRFETNTCSAGLWDLFRPKVNPSDSEKQERDQDWCPDCTAAVEGMTIWRMLVAPIDTLLSLMPRLLVFISKWIVILFANILQSAMNPRAGTFFDDVNRFTGKGNVARWIWQNSLYFANIMITLFLIWIAINIILEKKEYISYHNLTKLLVVALLINFSLVICTLLVDISNYVASLFMSGVNGQAFSCVYACSIHKVANSFNCVADKMMLSQTIQNSLALVVAIIFIGQLLGLIIFVFTRMIYLWFLVGVSPLAIVLSAIPETEGIYKKWLGLFQTNLIKLPAIAAATYFILNIILFIANKSMTTYVERGDVMEHVLSTTFIIIILSQGLLMAAQAIGVEQVAKMSSMVNGVVKKGWDAARKPLAQQSQRFASNMPFARKGVELLQNSRQPWIARAGNKLAAQTTKYQKGVATNLEDLFQNGNWRSLEKLADSKDPVIRTQAMAYLAQLKPNVYTSKHKYTEDAARINQIKNLADTNSYIENSDAYDVLKKTLPLFKTGIKPLDGKNNKEQINKTVGEISALLNSDKGAINLESTLEVLMKNAGDNLPYLMKVLQNTIDPTILNNKAKSLGNKGYLGLMDTLAKGIIVAKKLKTGKIKPGEVRENLDTFLPDDETSEAYKKTRAYISEHLEEDAAEIAEDDTYNFFGKWGRKDQNPLKRTAQGRLYLAMNKKSVRANAGDNGRQSKTKNNIPVNKESSTDDAAPTDDNKNNSNTSSSVSDTPKNIPGAESQTKNTPSPEDNKTSNDKTEDVKNTFQEKFDNLHKEIETITSKLNGIVPEIKGLAPKINGTINSTGESRGGEYRSLQNSLSELEKKLETNTSYTFSTKYMLEELMNKLDKMKRLQDDNDNLPK